LKNCFSSSIITELTAEPKKIHSESTLIHVIDTSRQITETLQFPLGGVDALQGGSLSDVFDSIWLLSFTPV